MSNKHQADSVPIQPTAPGTLRLGREKELKTDSLRKGRKRSLVLLGLFVALFVIFVGGRLPYFLLYVYILGLLLPLGHSFLGWLFLKGEVVLPSAELVAGEEITLRYRVENPLKIPFPRIELDNQLGKRLTGKQGRRKIFSLHGKDWMEETTTLLCRRRGFYQTGTIKILVSDIFQLFTLEKIIAAPISLKVYPKVTTIDRFHLTASQQMGNLKVRDPLFQDYTELADLRQYREGDPVKRVHWKVSAGKDQLMVKEFEERGDTQVLMVLDSEKSHYRGDEEGWVEDHLVEGAAALIDYCLRRNIKVSMTYLRQGKPIYYEGDTTLHIKHFLDGLALFQPGETTGYEKQVEISTQQLPHGTALFFMTPELTKETAFQGIRLIMKNQQPLYMIFGDRIKSPQVWQYNRKMAKRLEGEGIACYQFEQGKSIRDVLEGTHGSGTESFAKSNAV